MAKKVQAIQINKEEATYDHVLKYTGLFGGVQGLTMLISIVRNKLVSLLLGPDGIGLIGTFNVVMNLINQSTNFGVSFSAVKHIAELNADDESQIPTITRFISVVRTWSLTTGLFAMLLTLALSPLISYFTFDSYDYTGDFALLSPMALTLALSGGEMAILKGLKKLQSVALTSIIGALTTLTICIPLYWTMGLRGVALSLLISNVVALVILMSFSCKIISWHTSIFSKQSYLEGVPMLKLGIGYIIAGIFGQGAELIIRTMILHLGSLADVGLYNSGYMMAVAYTSIVFIAMEADYFPRLSEAKCSVPRQNFTVNQQIEVCVLLIAPILIAFVIAMPFIVQILYSNKFIEAVPMTICASLYMFFRALTLPVAYLSLAHGDSKTYMITELLYDIFIAIAIPVGYNCGGLMGTGIALSLAGVFDLVMIYSLYIRKYNFSFSTRLTGFYLVQFTLLSCTIYSSIMLESTTKWAVNIVALIISSILSFRILSRETSFVSKLKDKFN